MPNRRKKEVPTVNVEDAMQKYIAMQKGLEEGGIADVDLKDSLRYMIRNKHHLEALRPQTKAAVASLRTVAKKRSKKLILALLAINAFCMGVITYYAPRLKLGETVALNLPGMGAAIMFSNYITYGTALDLDQNIAEALSESGTEVKLGQTSMPGLFTGPHAVNTEMATLSLNLLVIFTVTNIFMAISAATKGSEQQLDASNTPGHKRTLFRMGLAFAILLPIFHVALGYQSILQSNKRGDQAVLLEDLARRYGGNYQTLMIRASEYAGKRGFIENLRNPLTYDRLEELLKSKTISLEGLKVTGLSITQFAAEQRED